MESTSKRATADTPLKIGVGVPLSGIAAALGREMANAVQLAFDEANDAGGINGRPIEAVILDDQGREEEGEALVKAFVDDTAAVAAVGHYNSNVTLRVAPLYAAAGMALVGPIVSNPALTHSGWGNIFRFTNSDDATGRAIACHLVHQLAKNTVVLIASDTVYGKSMSREFASAFECAGGSVLQRHTVTEGETSFRSLVESFPREAGAIFYGGTFEGAPLLKEMRARKDDRLFATGDGCWDIGNFLEPAGSAAERGEGVLVLSACPQLGDVPGSLEFAARYELRFGPIKNYAVNSFDAAMTLIDAVRSASNDGSPTRDKVASALWRTHRRGIAYERPIQWTANGDNLAAVTALHRIEGGRYRQISLVDRSLADFR